jgi:cytochrome c oxidase assembly factor CtaG
MDDQQLGGLIMWIPCGVVFVVVGLAMFAAWIGESERRQQYTRLAAVMSPEFRSEHGQ